MTEQPPPVMNNSVAKATFGLLIILSILWAAGGLISTIVQGHSFDWVLILSPLALVILFQTILVWVAATIRAAAMEGVAAGFVIRELQEKFPKNRESIN